MPVLAEPSVFAQTGQVPDAGQLKEQAAKAMDKDDKKKMGEEKFNTFKRIRKILQGKNAAARNMAKNVEEILDGKTPDARPARSPPR